MIFLLMLVVCLSPIDGLEWNTLDNALQKAKTDQVPIMFLMTKTGCKPCQKLNDLLEQSSDFKDMASKFVLAKATDKDIPSDEKFKMDGKYVPKIVFLNHFGSVIQDVVNIDIKNEKARYFYSKVDHVVKSMNRTIVEYVNTDHGFGKDFNWYNYENGLKAAEKEDKPILMVFHQEWCGACSRLKPKVAESQEMKDLAHEFIFVNTDNEELVKGDRYKADGEYYPKILFLESNGDHMKEEWNHGTQHNHVLHYYGDGKEISESMKRVLANRTKVERQADRGFGTHIKWVTYKSGLQVAKKQNKPMMLIIHKTYCGACKALKPRIRNNEAIGKLSQQFVMVNCEDDEEPYEDQFDIDGAYIPRVFFLDNNGKVEQSIHTDEKDFKQTAYAYGTADALIRSMKKALEMNMGNRESGQESYSQSYTQAPVQQQQQEPAKVEEVDVPGFPKLKFDEKLKWFEYEDGLREAKKSHKASMLVFYNDYCQFSTFMVKQIHETPQIVELSKKFVMVKIDEEKMHSIKDKERFDLDGTYTPKIIFMDPDQHIYSDVNNTDTVYTSVMYYYGDGDSILSSMRYALTRINLTLGNGFGEYIEWVGYEKSFDVAAEQNKPIMLIIHKTWCGACKALKPVIEFSRPIWELTAHFVMVNVEDDSEPLDNQYFVDGGYYPRIFVLNPQGKVDRALHNRDPNFLKHKYSYGTEEHLLMMMRFGVHKYSGYARHSGTTNTQNTNTQNTQQQQGQQQQQQQQTQQQGTTTGSDSGLSAGKQLLAKSGAKFHNIYEATDLSVANKQPILFLIHRTTCPSCKALIKTISRSKDFAEKTKDFVLADIEDDIDEKKADSYDVDGGYVPRIYFVDPEGQVMSDIWNVGTNYPTTKFYYYDLESIYKSSAKAMKHMETWQPGQNKKQKDEL